MGKPAILAGFDQSIGGAAAFRLWRASHGPDQKRGITVVHHDKGADLPWRWHTGQRSKTPGLSTLTAGVCGPSLSLSPLRAARFALHCHAALQRRPEKYQAAGAKIWAYSLHRKAGAVRIGATTRGLCKRTRSTEPSARRSTRSVRHQQNGNGNHGKGGDDQRNQRRVADQCGKPRKGEH